MPTAPWAPWGAERLRGCPELEASIMYTPTRVRFSPEGVRGVGVSLGDSEAWKPKKGGLRVD